MKLQLFAIATPLLLNTHQTHTMDKFSQWISSWSAYGAQVAPPITPKKMVPLTEFNNAMPSDKEVIYDFNNLTLSNTTFCLLRLFADVEKNVATIEKNNDCPKEKRKKYLKSILPTLQKPDVEYYRNDQLIIDFYEKIRPQLIANGTEKEYFKNRLDKYCKKREAFKTAVSDSEKARDSNKKAQIILDQTGFEPDHFLELCCCASETPTEVLKIIHDYADIREHQKRHK